MISKLDRFDIIYCRFSSAEQKQGLSIEGQISVCRDYRKNKYPDDGSKIVVLKDEALSGKLSKRRPAYMQILEYARRGLAKRVFVDKYERLGRAGPVTEIDIRRIEDLGVQIISTKESSDLFMRALFGAINEKRLRDDADNTLRGMRELARQGFVPGGPVNFGWKGTRIEDPLGKRDKDGRPVLRTVYEIVAAEAAVVRRIFLMYDRGAGMTRIAKMLNREGAPSPKYGTGSWSANSIGPILRNKKYAGFIRFDLRHFKLTEKETRTSKVNSPDKWIEIDSPYVSAIIDLDLWMRVNAKFERRKGTCPRGPSAKHPLTGIVTCAICGNPCHVVTNKRKGRSYRYLRCGIAAKRGETICNNKAYARHDNALEALVEGLERHLFSSENLAYLTSRVRSLVSEMLSGSTDDRTALQQQLAGTERKIAGLVSYIEENGASNPEIPGQLQERCAERDALRRQLQNLKKGNVSTSSLTNLDSKIRGLAGKTRELLTTATIDAFREEIRKHVKVVELHPDRRIRVVGTLDGLLQGAVLPIQCNGVAGARIDIRTDSKTFEFWLVSKGAAA